jgi:hypothetical protein
MPAGRFTLEFYQSPDGDEPARRWMQKRLSAPQRRALDAALRLILAVHGVGVCGGTYGRHVGRGLFEFRLDDDEATVLHKWDPGSTTPRPATPRDRILLRVFCHAHGDRIVLLLGGYDKGADPSRRKQRLEIVRARARLRDFLRRRPSGRDGVS